MKEIMLSPFVLLAFSVDICAEEYKFVMKWPEGVLYFKYPSGVAVDSYGNVYVADTNNNRIQKFSSTGKFITMWGTLGTGNGQFSGPSGIAVDGSGNIYVADTNNNRIQKLQAMVYS